VTATSQRTATSAESWRTAAQKPALLTGLRPHRREHTLTSTSHFSLSLRTEQDHQRLMDWAVQFNRTTGLG
jgi:hypothetical protein